MSAFVDVINYCMIKKLPAVVVCVYFENAFDRVNYESLLVILNFFVFWTCLHRINKTYIEKLHFFANS